MNPYERLIDANINRVCEGLRTIEDIVRFLFNNKANTQTLKEFRHKARSWANNCLSNRDSFSDCGSTIINNKEISRSNTLSIFFAANKRIQEGLRVLEETFKLINPKNSAQAKNLRYKMYDLEKELVTTINTHLKTFPKHSLYLVLTPELCLNTSPLDIAQEALDAGVNIIQLRSKTLSDKDLITLGKNIKALTIKSNALFIVNDRVDLALCLNADGVHLGQDDISVKMARKLLGPDKIIGLSCHNQDQIHDAQKLPISYMAIGPVFATSSKQNPEPCVGESIFNITQNINIPIVAIGGINTQNINKLTSKGITRVAVIKEITQAKNINKTVKNLMKGIYHDNTNTSR